MASFGLGVEALPPGSRAGGNSVPEGPEVTWPSQGLLALKRSRWRGGGGWTVALQLRKQTGQSQKWRTLGVKQQMELQMNLSIFT